MRIHRTIPIAALLTCLAAACGSTGKAPDDGGTLPEVRGGRPRLELLGSYETGVFGRGAAEIVAYDPESRRLFVTNGAEAAVDIVDISNPAKPRKISSIDITPWGVAPTSVAVHEGLVAVAIEARRKTDPGKLGLFDTSGQGLSVVPVGPLPDMVTFTPDGKRVLVANEGEPSGDAKIDPDGSISIVDVSKGGARVTAGSVRAVSLAGAPVEGEIHRPGRGRGASTVQDMEPEYIAVGPNGKRAWVVLQECNAIATIDLEAERARRIVALGEKDHAAPGGAFDASDRDGGPRFESWRVLGMYQPDAIAAYEVDGETYLITANEGDGQDYPGFSEMAPLSELTLDPIAFPERDRLQEEGALGRLQVTRTRGDADGDGDLDRIYAFGSRSFSIWTAQGKLVWDSGDTLERITADAHPANFNASNDSNEPETRSPRKGPEPEALAVASLDGKWYAFVGCERIGGIFVYDVSDPFAPDLVQYRNDRDFSAPVDSPEAGHLGPEGICFIPARKSPTGKPLVAIAYEASGTVAVYSFQP